MNKSLFKFLFLACAFFPFYAFAQPSNDLCAGATSLTLGGPCVAGTTAAANDNIAGAVGCQSGGSNNNHNDVWYTFTANASIFTASITTSVPFTGNVEVTLIAGSCASGTVINSNCLASPANVSFNGLTAGTSYFLVISNRGNGTAGPFTICNYTTTSSSCTANDDCFTAQTLTLNAVGSGSACITGCNTGASPGLDFVGSGCEDMPNPTVWYTFTTGATAAQINVSLTSAAMSDPEFVIFSNTTACLGPYSILNCTEGTSGSAVTNSIAVAANTTYYIAVSDATGDQGSFNLCVTQNPDNSACNTTDNLTVTATSMGSPLAGPYLPGEQVTFQYTLTNWIQINCNYIGAFVPTFGNCWDPASFNAQGMPVIINTPLNVNGVIQTSPLGPQNPCAGTPAGSWNWFPAGSVTYNVNGSLPAGTPMGAGWYFLSSYNPATGACTGGDPTDPDNTYGDGNYPDCGDNTFDYTLRFTLTAGPTGNCGLGLTDCGVSIKTYADGEFGAWNSIGCTVDLPVAMSPTLSCCQQPTMTSTNTLTICSGDVASITLTSDIASTYTWIATNNTNVTGESTTAQTTGTLSNTLVNNSGVVQTVIYTVTPTSTASCVGIPQTVTITVVPNPTVAVSNATTCAGTPTVLTASGATTYSWSTGATTSTISTSTAGVYTVTGTTNGCTNTRTVSLTVTANPTVAVSDATTCAGTPTVLTASGATTYSWSTGATTATISTSTAGIYTVTGTTSGCTNTQTVSLTVTASPTVAVANATTCAGTPVTFTATGATTYSWSTGATTSTISTSTAGVYTVTGTTSGCTNTRTVSLTVTANPTVAVANATTCAGTPVTFTATGATTYSWSTGATTSTISTSTAGVYTVTGTTSGCTNTQTVSLTANANPTVAVANATTCAGTPVTFTASGATTYSWSTGATTSTISTSTAGVYTVTGTTSGCTNTQTVSLSVTPNPTVAVSNVTICAGTPTVLTASGATTYSWSTGATTSTISTSTAGVYTVTGTTNGCTNTQTVSLTASPIPTTAASTTGTLTCTSLSVTLNSTLAGVNYTWTAPAGGTLGTPNSQNTSATGATGTYTLFVQSAAGCTYSTTTSVTQNTVAPTGVNAGPGGALTCAVGSSVTLTGSVTTPTNATANWSGPNICGSATSFTTASCGAGIYTLTATDPANGCTATSTVQVSPSAGAPAVTNNPVTNTLTCTNTLVAVSITTTVTPVSYTWSGPGIVGATTNSVVNVSSGGIYNYTVTNTSNGCTTSNSQAVSQNTAVPTATATSTGTLTCVTNTVVLNTSLSGMNYTWTAPAGGSVSSANTQSTSASGVAGTYSLTVVDPANGCSFATTTSVTQNTMAPVTVASTTGTLTCSNNTVTLNSTLAGVNYTWTAPVGGSVASANTQSTTASAAAGDYTLTIVDPSNGCSNTAITTVTQNTTAPTTTATVSGSVTCVTTTVTLNSTLAGVNYTWTAPSGSSITSGVNSQNAIGSGTGTYTLGITDPSNGCYFETTAVAGSDLSTPTGVNAGPSQTLTCLPGSSVTLSGSVTGPVGTTANWLGGVCGVATSFTTSACAAGVYTLEATHPGTGCTATATVEVFSPPGAPSASITPITNSITCTNTVVNVEMTTTELTYTVNWSGPGIIGSTTTNTIDVNQGGVYSVTVTNTGGCATIINATVPTNTSVVTPLINGSATITCSTPSTTLDVTPAGSAYSYTWTGPGIVGSSSTSSIVANAGGNYDVTVTETANGCTGTASITVIANGAIPTATISAVSSNTVITCANTNVDLIVNSTPSTDMTYVWFNSANTQTTSVTSAGTYSVVATNTLTGCFTSAVITITSNIAQPSVSVADATITCGASSATIGAVASNVSYTWTTSGTGSILANANTAIPTVGSAGQYVVTVTDNTNGCTNSGTVNVAQNAISTAISANPMSGTAPLSVDFSNNSTGGSNYSWNFGDTNNNTSASSAPTHTYNTVGTYVVTFTVTDASGSCSATASLTIEVFENSTIIVPNVFTPNSDDANDVFGIKTAGINTLTCDIFNRWGQKMFTINSPNETWDGKSAGGADAPDGTYFFMLKATGFDGKEYEQQGYLNLFR